METSFCRKVRTISSTWTSPIPAASALSPAFWITAPSALGSENGTPSSRMSAPAATMPCISAGVMSTYGKPAVTYGMSAVRPVAFRAAKVAAMRLIRVLPGQVLQRRRHP